MAARYSNPSSGLGVNRFRVWPNKTTDAYNTTELTANFDKQDAMIGVPAAGTQWPPTEGIDGGIYREVKTLQNDRLPIGSVFAWWRPNGGVPLPSGCVECIGQTLIAAQHAFVGGGTIVIPDLRNKFILSADSTLAPGQAAAVVGSGVIDTYAGAPGLGAVGGSNQTIMTIPQLPAHDHGGGAHDHGGGNHAHGVTDNGHSHSFNRQQIGLQSGGPIYLINVRDTITHTESTLVSQSNVSVNASGSIIPSVAPVASQGTGAPHDNRPGYVGLIYLMKVLYSTAP